MSDKCDSLKALAELETRLEIYYAEKGYCNIRCMKQMIAELEHEIQTNSVTTPNEIKKNSKIFDYNN